MHQGFASRDEHEVFSNKTNSPIDRSCVTRFSRGISPCNMSKRLFGFALIPSYHVLMNVRTVRHGLPRVCMLPGECPLTIMLPNDSPNPCFRQELPPPLPPPKSAGQEHQLRHRGSKLRDLCPGWAARWKECLRRFFRARLSAPRST